LKVKKELHANDRTDLHSFTEVPCAVTYRLLKCHSEPSLTSLLLNISCPPHIRRGKSAA